MIKVWGRNTSSNVQKVMWAIGEIGLPHQRIDVGGGRDQVAHGGRRPAMRDVNSPGAQRRIESDLPFC